MDFETLSVHLDLARRRLLREHRMMVLGTAAAIGSVFSKKILPQYLQAIEAKTERPGSRVASKEGPSSDRVRDMMTELNKLGSVMQRRK